MKKKLNILISLLSILLIVFSISFLYTIFKLNILKYLYLLIITIITIILDYVIIKNLENKNNKKILKIILSVLSIFLIILYIILIKYLIDTFKFIETITKPNNEYLEYSVLVKDKNISINELNDKYIGFISNNNIYAEKKELSKEATISYVSRDYKDAKTINEALKNDNVSAIVVSSNMLESYKDNNIDIFSNYNIIYKFNIKINNNYTNNTLLNNPFIILFTGKINNYNLNNVTNNNINTLVIVNPKSKKILYVDIPNKTIVKTNDSYKDRLEFVSNYGIDKTIDVINKELDVNINYYVKTNKKIYKSNFIYDKNSYYTNLSYNQIIYFIRNNLFKKYDKEYYMLNGNNVILKSYTFYENFEMFNVNEEEKEKLKTKIKNFIK